MTFFTMKFVRESQFFLKETESAFLRRIFGNFELPCNFRRFGLLWRNFFEGETDVYPISSSESFRPIVHCETKDY